MAEFLLFCVLVVSVGSVIYALACAIACDGDKQSTYRIVRPRYGRDALMGYSYRGRVEHMGKRWCGVIDRRFADVWEKYEFQYFATEKEAREWVMGYLDAKDWTPDPKTYVR